MKTRFSRNLPGLTGKLDGLVYYYHQGLDEIIARTFTQAERNPPADRMKLIMANLKLIQPSAGYKQNLKDYAIKYNNLRINRDKPEANWMNLWLKLMFGMTKALPGIDLTTITRQQIYDDSLPCITVRNAIECSLLPNVRNSERYTELI
ncbi:hypothetical protein FJY84_02975 [Candidatus Bathyarchaeota archaeon]|nr:hypothetical protein [Candidatus Bathyarchaeota archaeon]